MHGDGGRCCVEGVGRHRLEVHYLNMSTPAPEANGGVEVGKVRFADTGAGSISRREDTRICETLSPSTMNVTNKLILAGDNREYIKLRTAQAKLWGALGRHRSKTGPKQRF